MTLRVVDSMFFIIGSWLDPEVKSPKKPYSYAVLDEGVICVDVKIFL